MSENLTLRRVILARPRGFCAGVVRAVDIVERALEECGSPVYVRHEIVHNRHVVDQLRAKGAVFVDEVDEVPQGATTVFSAHGVSKSVEAAAAARRLDVIDATCPLVRKVHKEGRGYAERDFDVILIGHDGHAEVEGTLGQIAGRVTVVSTVADIAGINVADESRVAYITQTTLSMFDTRDIIAALRNRFPKIVGPDTRNICYATQNRQKAVIDLAKEVQVLVVVGSPNSSNANRLRELGEAEGVKSYLIDRASDMDPVWFDGVHAIGVTAGASTPEVLVDQAIVRLSELSPIRVEVLDGADENVRFRLPDRFDKSSATTSCASAQRSQSQTLSTVAVEHA